jgi:hypothetical protein
MSFVKTFPVTNCLHWGSSFLFQIEQVTLSTSKCYVLPSAWVSSTAIWSVPCDVYLSKHQTFTKCPKPWTAYIESALLHSICHWPYVKLLQTLTFYYQKILSWDVFLNTINYTTFLLRPQCLYLQFLCHKLKVTSNRLPPPTDVVSVQVSNATQNIWNGRQ